MVALQRFPRNDTPVMPAKRTCYKHDNPRVRRVLPPAPEIASDVVANKCRYVGSPYHRTIRVNGIRPENRLGKPPCPKEIQVYQDLVEGWLRSAIRQGNFGKFDRGFPRVVWHEEDGKLFEARQSGRGSCEYHGFPLGPHDKIIGMT